ncbi:MAG: response regulator [Ignavibacteriaceae bacterium]
MQNSKDEFLKKLNVLTCRLNEDSKEFVSKLCENLVEEFDFESVVIFKILNDNNLKMLGKSAGAKKSYNTAANYQCKKCTSLVTRPDSIIFDKHPGCELPASESEHNGSSLILKLPGERNVLVKISQPSTLDRIEDKIEEIGKFISNLLILWFNNINSGSNYIANIITNIAHELRTPTNSVMGFASLLNEDTLSPSQAEYVVTLKENAFNHLSLINDLIDLAKIESGNAKELFTSIKIRPFIDEILKLFKDKALNKNIDFLLNIEKDIPESVKLDSQKLRYIFISLITYSLRLTEKGKITISISSGLSNKLNIKISDTSNGLSQKQIKEIFNPFSLSDLGNNKIGSSSGLSLTLSKKYVEFLNGEIEVSSSIGKGTNYYITLSTENLSSIVEKLSALPKPGAKNRVLVVEDDYATSKLLSNYLTKWGYDPVVVNSADQALKSIEKEIFLAVLMDIVLPDANGFELLKNIRENKNCRNTPIIVCSVEAEQQKAFLMGAVEYFVKPIKYKYLVEVLQNYRLKRDSNILIVDDDIPTLNLVKEVVEQAGYNAVAESHSGKVNDMIENMKLDLAIIDLDMPEVNGYDLIKQIKSKPNFSKLPVIIYTGKENYKEDLKKIDGLFEDLLEKNSTNIEELSGTIKEMINRYDEPTPPEKLKEEPNVVKILLVEDYKHSQIIVTRLLKKNSFEHIVVVENGVEALEKVKEQKFDLILMDMQMPIMNGFEATEKIRELPEYKDTPIIALTAFAMKGDREKCLDAGATDYIPKPIDSQEFIEKVKYYTESRVSV